jgi:galactose mutarotase-like enzyme
MPALHSTTHSAGLPVDILRADNFQIAVCRKGAEIYSLKLENGDGTATGFLHRDGILESPTSGWANHATVMGYYIHRLWHEQSTYEGMQIHGGNHGFLRHFDFNEPVFDEATNSLAYHVPAAEVPREFYPLKVSSIISYRIPEPGTLEVAFDFANEETGRPAHLSFGLHPGFAVGNLEKADFLMPPGTYRRLMAPGNFLSGEVQTIEHPGGPMPFEKSGLPASYLLDLSGVPQRVFELVDHSGGRSIRFDFRDCPFLTLWSDAQDFLCIEPCWGMPDSNPPVPFEQKIGIQTIPAGGTLKKTFRIAFQTVQKT